MRAFIAALVVAVAIAAGASAVLGHYQETAAVAFSTQGVRL